MAEVILAEDLGKIVNGVLIAWFWSRVRPLQVRADDIKDEIIRTKWDGFRIGKSKAQEVEIRTAITKSMRGFVRLGAVTKLTGEGSRRFGGTWQWTDDAESTMKKFTRFNEAREVKIGMKEVRTNWSMVNKPIPKAAIELWPGVRGDRPWTYGYARVSTANQDLSDQIQQLKFKGAQVIFKEKFTGTTMDRPEFDRLLETLEPGDTLIVTKMDRLARTVSEAIKVLDELNARDVRVDILNIGSFETRSDGQLTAVSKMMRTILLAFAEFERDMIVERTQAGKAYAKANNKHYREGRKPKISGERLDQMLEYYEDHSVKETTLAFGVSKATLMRRVAEAKAKKVTE